MTWVPPVLPVYRHARARSPFANGLPQAPASAGPSAETGVGAANATGVALDELRLVGTLRVAGEAWALIKPPDGRVQLVRAGDSFGAGHVLAVEPTRIRLMAGRGTDTAGEAGKREVQLTLDD
jgi:Tfp pilus assembly protein PilP